MSTLQIKGLPPELKERLLRRARARGITLKELALEALWKELEAEEWEERLRKREPTNLGLPAARLLEEAREERE